MNNASTMTRTLCLLLLLLVYSVLLLFHPTNALLLEWSIIKERLPSPRRYGPPRRTHSSYSIHYPASPSSADDNNHPNSIHHPVSPSSSDVNNHPNGDKKWPYQFGDLTRGALKGFQEKVNKKTGKESYRFGDLSRWLDSQAKEKVAHFTGNADGSYQFGDISKEILLRLQQNKYNRDDLILLLKIVVTIGMNFSPVARILPLKVLVELLNLSLEASLAQTVGEKILSALTKEIDARMKAMVTGDRNYQLGDYTKRFVTQWTGKGDAEYEFGNITRTVLSRMQNQKKNDAWGEDGIDGEDSSSSSSAPKGEINMEHPAAATSLFFSELSDVDQK